MTNSVVIRERSATRPSVDAVTWLSLYAVLLLLVPAHLVFGPLGSAGAVSLLFGLASLLVWVAYRLQSIGHPALKVTPVQATAWLFCMSVGLSYAIAAARPMSFDEISPADVALLSLASWVGPLLVAHDGIGDRSRLEKLVWRLSLLAAAMAALGLVQVVTGQAWVDRITVPGMTSIEVSGNHLRDGQVRPAGTATHPIEFGAMLTILAPLAMHVATYGLVRNKLLRWLPLVLILMIIPLSLSRSAYLGLAIGLVIYLVGWRRRQRILATLLALAGMVAVGLARPGLVGTISGLFTGASEDPSITSRTASFEFATGFIDRNPWFGRGLGTFLPKYRIFDNEYLLLMVTAGVVGTSLFIAIGAVAVLTLIRVRQTMTDERTRDLAVSLIASITVGYASLAMFDAFAYPMTMGMLFLCLGMAGSLWRLNRGKRTDLDAVPNMFDRVAP